MFFNYDAWKTTNPNDTEIGGGAGFSFHGTHPDDHYGVLVCNSCGLVDDYEIIEVNGQEYYHCDQCGNTEIC